MGVTISAILYACNEKGINQAFEQLIEWFRKNKVIFIVLLNIY
jgi:DNA gyrase inhibitor GyrI